MSEWVQIGRSTPIPKAGSGARRPPWLRVKISQNDAFREVGQLLEGLNLNTVCEDARCPNIWECWGKHRTATFMILGEVCTRACRYCSVTSGRPPSLPDPEEPQNVAEAVARLGLKYAVITSVDRDDLPDLGAGHFAATIAAIRQRTPDCHIEVLIPDFQGQSEPLQTVLRAGPDILDHNTEVVSRLYRRMRPRGQYEWAMGVLREADRYRRSHDVAMTTKSGLMVGLGETLEELFETMRDLRAVHCDVLTVGQYLNPTKKHAPIDRYVTPEEFDIIRRYALDLGFAHCECGPLVRSSYHAHDHVPGGRALR